MNDGLGTPKKRVIGWREWLALPELGIGRIKAKVDSGARSSSLHAVDVQRWENDGKDWVKFRVYPIQRSHGNPIEVSAPVLDFREVRSSSGEAETRPVIRTAVRLCGQQWPIDLSLTNRNEMGFRMLLGREAIRGRFLLDAGGSYLARKARKKGKK